VSDLVLPHRKETRIAKRRRNRAARDGAIQRLDRVDRSDAAAQVAVLAQRDERPRRPPQVLIELLGAHVSSSAIERRFNRRSGESQEFPALFFAQHGRSASGCGCRRGRLSDDENDIALMNRVGGCDFRRSRRTKPIDVAFAPALGCNPLQDEPPAKDDLAEESEADPGLVERHSSAFTL
jgi:hypothetical protein